MHTSQSIHAFLDEHPDIREQLLSTTDAMELSTIAWNARSKVAAFARVHGERPWTRLHSESKGSILHCFAYCPHFTAVDAAMMWLRKFRPAGWTKMKAGGPCADATLDIVRVILDSPISHDELKELVRNPSQGTMPCEQKPVEGNTPENMSNPATFELRPFAEGEDLSQASPNRLLQLVKAHKADIQQLRDVGVESAFISNKIAKKEELIAQIVGILDSKEVEE